MANKDNPSLLGRDTWAPIRLSSSFRFLESSTSLVFSSMKSLPYGKSSESSSTAVSKGE